MVGGAPLVRSIDCATHVTQGSDGSSRLALKNPPAPDRISTFENPLRSRWRRSAGTMSSTAVPTT